MPVFKIEASREVLYEFEVEAETEAEAEDQVRQIEMHEDVEIYAYGWYPLDITSIEEEE